MCAKYKRIWNLLDMPIGTEVMHGVRLPLMNLSKLTWPDLITVNLPSWDNLATIWANLSISLNVLIEKEFEIVFEVLVARRSLTTK